MADQQIISLLLFLSTHYSFVSLFYFAFFLSPLFFSFFRLFHSLFATSAAHIHRRLHGQRCKACPFPCPPPSSSLCPRPRCPYLTSNTQRMCACVMYICMYLSVFGWPFVFLFCQCTFSALATLGKRKHTHTHTVPTAHSLSLMFSNLFSSIIFVLSSSARKQF